jgi:hypothetical protein
VIELNELWLARLLVLLGAWVSFALVVGLWERRR